MSKTYAAITAMHGWVPEDRLTNDMLSEMVDTNDEWITSRTGIKERRILKGENKGTSEIGANAVKGLLEKRGIGADEIDLLICSTITGDYQFPATANIISDKVGAKNAWSFDVAAACSGFVFALSVASQYVETGKYKKVVVVGVDKMSSIIDYTDRTTCIIFGDGGGAALLEPTQEQLGVMDFAMGSDGSGMVHLHQKAGGSVNPASHATVDARQHSVFQSGQAVFKFAVTKMADIAEEVLRRNNLTGDDIAWLVPHQANLRIIDATARRIGVGDEKVMKNIQKYGNTTNGTLPLCLWEWESQLKKGDNLILAAFGGGFTWGAIYLKWAYDTK